MAKIREGFVSNSSSSSFILPVDSNTDEITITIPTNQLENLIGGGDYDDSGIRNVIETEEELKEYILDEYGWRESTIEEVLNDSDYVKDIYDNSLEYIKEGKKILMGRVSYHDRGLENILRYLGAKIEN